MTTSPDITMLSTAVAAERLGVSVATLKLWRKAKRGPVYRLRYGRAFYAESDLIAFVEAQPKFSGGQPEATAVETAAQTSGA